MFVYVNDVELYGREKAHQYFMEKLFKHSMLDERIASNKGDGFVYDEVREALYPSRHIGNIGNLMENDKFDGFAPLVEPVDDYDTYLDDVHTAHVIGVLFSEEVVGDTLVDFGTNIEGLVRNPLLLTREPRFRIMLSEHNELHKAIIESEPYIDKDSLADGIPYNLSTTDLLLNLIRSKGFVIEDINIDKFVELARAHVLAQT
jgi:hypothetical protein